MTKQTRFSPKVQETVVCPLFMSLFTLFMSPVYPV